MGWSNFLFTWIRSFQGRVPNSTLRIHADVVELDTNGRFIILRLKTQGEDSLNVVNVYAPTDNREQIEFLDAFF